jgi:hypothetical protein
LQVRLKPDIAYSGARILRLASGAKKNGVPVRAPRQAFQKIYRFFAAFFFAPLAAFFAIVLS